MCNRLCVLLVDEIRALEVLLHNFIPFVLNMWKAMKKIAECHKCIFQVRGCYIIMPCSVSLTYLPSVFSFPYCQLSVCDVSLQFMQSLSVLLGLMFVSYPPGLINAVFSYTVIIPD